MAVAEFTLETGNSSTKTRLSVNLRTGNSKLYGVFDELDVLSSSAPFCLLKRM